MAAEKWIIASVSAVWLVICAVYDAKDGEVPNWLTLPGMAAGVLYALIKGGDRLIIMLAAFGLLIVLFILGSTGGADVKVLTGLSGLWPVAMIAAFFVQGLWGIVVLIKKGRGSEFRAIPSYAVGALLSFALLL